MPKLSDFDIIDNKPVARDTYSLSLFGDCSEVTAPGQFVNLELPGFYLRRPFSVCSVSGGLLTIVYKVVGAGTKYMSGFTEGGSLSVLSGLGNGFDISLAGERPALVGGGLGAAPLYGLASELIKAGAEPTVFLGFNNASEIFLAAELAALGARVFISTADGSAGIMGFVTDAMESAGAEFGYVYACGPEPMLKAVYDRTQADGQYSFEERMACGFGACMGCSCMTKYGSKRICRDGPVLTRGEIIW